MRSPHPWLALLLVSPLAGCVAQTLLASNYAALTQELQGAHARTNCAPKDLAIADANYAFAQLEFKQGNTRRAEEHIDIAREHAAIAAACPAVEVAQAVAPVPVDGDRDGDGLKDSEDACPTEAEDLDGFKDSDGCPERDNDGDGIPDGSDGCPNAAEDLDGYQDQDGCPDADNDGDGVPDGTDACPNAAGTAANRGCPTTDRDSDGIADDEDRCPDQPETPNDYMDTDGCPDVKPSRIEITANKIVIKQRINFATGKATILADSFPVLDDVAQVLKDYPAIKVEIQGHTDNVGDEMANQNLSKARADSVFEYLLKKGILANRMVTAGYGESRPIDTNTTDAGRLNNRRVEFVILEQ